MLHRGDCLEVLKRFEENSIDSLVTDPPAGISFMGKAWDKSDGFIPAMTEIFKETIRCLKPGGHGLVWALPRTSHWTATALESAGFEIRDVVIHLFGSGFPKSRNLGDGWGTALKPASEHWILVRKPCSEKTVAANVLKWGTGGINIDASRIGSGEDKIPGGCQGNIFGNKSDDLFRERKGGFSDSPIYGSGNPEFISKPPVGRFPANLVLDEEAAQMLDEQVKGKLHAAGNKKPAVMNKSIWESGKGFEKEINFGDFDGGASRFFYVAKASKKDRNEGCEELPQESCTAKTQNSLGRMENGIITNPRPQEPKNQNHHPTVKSTKLMEYLITLVTPPNGTVLDPFMGSGSTGKAALGLGFKFIGIEKEQEYFEIAERRIAWERRN